MMATVTNDTIYQAQLAAEKKDVNKVLKIVLPVLRAISSLWFIPAKWRTLIKVLVELLDGLDD